jgi:hypothetical protein
MSKSEALTRSSSGPGMTGPEVEVPGKLLDRVQVGLRGCALVCTPVPLARDVARLWQDSSLATYLGEAQE